MALWRKNLLKQWQMGLNPGKIPGGGSRETHRDVHGPGKSYGQRRQGLHHGAAESQM